MEFRENDFIETTESNSVFRGKLWQIIAFGDQRKFGHTQRFARIKNMETKAEVNIEEPMLARHFKKVDYKNIGSEQKDNDWFLDECRLSDTELDYPKLKENQPEEKTMTPIEMTKLALSQISPKCPKCSHSMANHGTIGNSNGKCLVPICSCGNDETKIPEDTIDQIALIRKLIRVKSKTLSVRNDRGTAFGWVAIRGSKTECGEFTDEEKKALDELGLSCGSNFATISPENRKYYLRKWLGLPQEKEFSY